MTTHLNLRGQESPVNKGKYWLCLSAPTAIYYSVFLAKLKEKMEIINMSANSDRPSNSNNVVIKCTSVAV